MYYRALGIIPSDDILCAKTLNHSALLLKLAQYGKSTILHFVKNVSCLKMSIYFNCKKAFPVPIEMIIWVLIPPFVDVLYHTDWFADIENSLHP